MFVILIFLLFLPFLKNRYYRKKVLKEKEFISVSEFGKLYSKGKILEDSGIYIFLIYDGKNDRKEDFKGVYVGQSIHVAKRLYTHLHGNGNHGVHRAITQGKYVCFCIIPCPKKNLNQLEKRYIAAFNATNSLNKTRGGAKKQH